MESSKIILVPIDFEEASLSALAKARELAGRLGLEVMLLHTYTIPVAIYPGFEPIMAPDLSDQIVVAARSSLEALATEQGGLRSELRCGDPAAEILRAVEELKPELVIMGTHGRKGLARLFLGSVAEKVVRSSPAPVLMVRAKAHSPA